MTVACIIQARMGSKRFPGKVMTPIWDRPMIEEVVEEAKNIEGVDVVAVAIPATDDNQVLYEFLKDDLGCHIWSGPEDDVLERYLGAAAWLDASVIMRITGDCPLIDASVCAGVLDLYHRNDVDFVSNVAPRTFPKGMDCEVFSGEVLLEAHRECPAAIREHVTTWMKWSRHLDRANYSQSVGAPNLSAVDLSVDTEDDMQRIRTMWAKRPTSFDEITARLRNDPA